MTTTINASTSSGLVNTADTSGVIKLQSNGVTTNALAWVNFNGTGTVAIRASYNVSSITDNGTGDYTVNFATALSDANYSGVATAKGVAATFQGLGTENHDRTRSASAFPIVSVRNDTGAGFDSEQVNVTIFGN